MRWRDVAALATSSRILLVTSVDSSINTKLTDGYHQYIHFPFPAYFSDTLVNLATFAIDCSGSTNQHTALVYALKISIPPLGGEVLT